MNQDRMGGATPALGPKALVAKIGLAAVRAVAAAAGTLVFVFLMAGLPLLFSEEARSFVFAPGRVAGAIVGFLSSLGDGGAFAMIVVQTPWDFRELGPGFTLTSFAYTALPGALGLGLGAYAGIAFRLRRRGALDRATDLALSIPDFFVIFIVQNLAVLFVHLTGIGLRFGATDGRMAFLPFACMTLFPFLFSYRTASAEARRAESEEFVSCARARGVPERDISRRHVGAAVIPRLETELPVLVAFMQGSLFIVEKVFFVPGMARFLYDYAFAGTKRLYFGPTYQYNAVVLSLICLTLSCVAVYATLRLALLAARKALTRE